jgi:hypothetical protein
MATAATAVSKLSPAQRSANFKLATRRYEQTLPTMTYADASTISVILPKSRFGAKLYIQIAGSFTCTHATKTTFAKQPNGMYNLLKQIRLQLNNGFNPYQISGRDLYLYNQVSDSTNDFLDSDPDGTSVMGNVVSSAGTVNTIKYTLEMPLTINERDEVGIVNLQNPETSCTLSIDCDTIKTSLMSDTDIAVSAVNIVITPVLVSFSIPALPDAVPDYSIIKLVSEQMINIPSNGDFRIALATGLTYRKILIYVASDTLGTPLSTAQLTKIQLAFNQADVPISVSADYIAWKNKVDYQGSLPKGCFCLDMSTQGIANLGGSGDYIDTDGITNFELVLSFAGISGTTNTVWVIAEKLAKLQ